MAEENNYDNFKNIGIDVDFIQTNADEHNNKIQQFYTGGNPEEQIHTNEKPQQTVKTKQETQDVEKPQDDKEKGIEQKMEQQVNMSEVETLVDKKVHELAVKMQQYADETDKKIAQLEQALAQVNTQTAQKSESTQSKTTEQATLSQEKSEKKPQEEKSGFERSDVSIDKMFDFSGNASGKIKR